MEPNFPAYAFLGRAYLLKGRYAEAIAEIQKELSVFGRKPITLALLAYAYEKNGMTNEALQLRDELEEQSRHTHVDPYHMATLYTGLKDNDQAFKWLQSAYEEHAGYLLFVKVDPLLKELHADSRFTALLAKMGLENRQL
jgi:tetratricopeptide (TPR) repeat protein